VIPLDLRPTRRRRPAVNVTSLIDVLFLLLIFFMVSSTFRQHPAIKLELPEAAVAEPSRTDALTLTISADRRLYLQGEEIELGALRDRLRTALADQPDLVVVLQADRKVDYGLVIEAIDLAKQAGVRKLSAFTEKPPPAPSP
jgi:biopolymer transport protein ExbD